MGTYVENKPTADILMLSMRSIGYSFESAVADIIDNSVSAKAHNIEIQFPNGPSDLFVAICDDGEGMFKEELFAAMKYGSTLKQSQRDQDDLGRFGLGLKSASLSQCRKLTVISKKNNSLSGYIWDLDVVEEKKEWIIIDCSSKEISNNRFINYLDNKDSGTIVMWENFDIIEQSSGNVYKTLMGYQEIVSNYLELIFHRFLNKKGPSKINIKINSYSLSGLDPFLENHKKTDIRRSFVLPVNDKNGIERYVIIQPYILPFQKDLSRDDQRLSGGIENYRSKQGFYIYRNERLIVWGTWFNRHRDELTKYARIKVDIPNSLDEVWGIDIKKQSATIPSSIKQRLTKAIDEAMDIATSKQKYRGRVVKADDQIDYVWDRIDNRGQISYLINRNSQIFNLIKNKVDDELWSYINMILEEIENCIPYQQIYIDQSQNRINDELDDERKSDLLAKAKLLIKVCSQGHDGVERASIVNRIMNSEPFNKYPELKKELMEE